jgi:hypothetical protein
MSSEESASLILDIFRRSCPSAGQSLSNKQLHVEYFKKSGSGLGFFDGVNWLLKKRWLEPVEGQENCHRMTKAGRQSEI